MNLFLLPLHQRAKAVIGVFGSPKTELLDQETAGKLLIETQPECFDSLEGILRSVISTWNVSVEQLPYYLEHVFGHDKVIEATAQLEPEYRENSTETNALRVLRWWLHAPKEAR